MILLWALDAWARAGGGQNYGGGGGGSTGGGGDFGGGGDLLQLLFLLGGGGGSGTVLVVVVVVVIFLVQARTRAAPPVRIARPVARPVEMGGLKSADPGFSRALFLDFARLVFQRAHEEAEAPEKLGALLGPEAQAQLRRRGAIREVIVGAARLNQISTEGGTHLRVYFEANFTEAGVQQLSKQMWTFSRPVGETSPDPSALRELRCPACGSALEARPDGRCRNCEGPLDHFPWTVSKLLVVDEGPVPRIALTPGGGVEVGTDLPTLASPSVRRDLVALAARHPDADWAALQRRFVDSFRRIQEAWAQMRWEDARPHETDFLYQQHRYWIARYRREGLQNRMADLAVTRVEPVKVELDRDVSVVVVRIFARMKDWTEAAGHLVSGSKTEDRIFSEYWTFLRSAAARGGGDGAHCPSCGAALDRVGESGVCGYCDSKITTGDFGWVLSAIDQDEAWRG